MMNYPIRLTWPIAPAENDGLRALSMPRVSESPHL
jgi:hypothetical protein